MVIWNLDHIYKLNSDQSNFDPCNIYNVWKNQQEKGPKIEDLKSHDCSRTKQPEQNYPGDSREELSDDTYEEPPEILENLLARVRSSSYPNESPKWFLRYIRDRPQPKNSLARLM